MRRLIRILTLLVMTILLMMWINDAVGDVRNPLAHWGFDGNGKDSVGDKDLKIQGGSFEAGKYGKALSLDGSGACAVDEDGGDYINGLDAITVAMWIKSNEVNTDRGFFICHEPEGSDKFLCIRYDKAGANGGGVNVIKAGVITDQGKTTVESSNEVQTTEWQHVAIVWCSSEQIQLYINGVLDKPTANEPPIGGKLSGLTKVIIGRGAKDQAGGWDGLIDDVYIYGEALSGEDIKKIMEGKALSVDASGKLATVWGKIKNDPNPSIMGV